MSSTIETAIASATSGAASASASAEVANANPASFKVIGVCLAVGSGLFIGSSFVVKKKGLLSAQAKSGGVAGEGHSYLKSPMWWTGMILMIVGEILNLVAYSFTEAILVTPLGALSVVICAILSSIFLKERLSFFGKIGCLLAILGAVIVALNGPQEQTTSTIPEFQKLFLAPGFLVFGSLIILVSLGLIFFVAPKYGKTHMLVYITICSLIGGLSVACTSGLGSSILTSIRGNSQFKYWFIYFLLGFVIVTLLTEINYLNKALELYNTAMVTPTYYVIFTGATLITSVVLNQGFKASPVDIVTVVMGFLVICCGITLLQLSKVDPVDVAKTLDRRTTILLSASHAQVHQDGDSEKHLQAEDPGMDSLRGSFGAIGSIHRAMSARKSMRTEGRFDPNEVRRRHGNGAPGAFGSGPSEMGMGPVRGVQLYDAPMPYDAQDKISLHSTLGSPNPRFASGDDVGRERSSSIKFATADNVHLYSRDPSSSATMHCEQDRLAGSHIHTSAIPGSADIATSSFSPSSALSPGGFSPSSSTSTFPSSSTDVPRPYLNPYEADDADDQQRRAQTMPRQGSSSALADRLAQHYANSAPEIVSSAPAESPLSPMTASRSRFALPSFSRESSREGNHRTAHPSGPPELDAQESERLVSGNRRDSIDSEGGEGGSERLDARDQM